MQYTRYSRLWALIMLSVLLGLSLLLESCSDKCTETYSYTYYEPVFTPLDVIRSSVSIDAPQPLVSIGKIYFKDGYLFVNEPGKGIHIIDNLNPSNPVNKYFINIPGNYDLAIKNNILYADSYIDLLALDISDLNNVKEVARLESIFNSYNSMGFYANAQQGVVTDWVEKDVSLDEKVCESFSGPWFRLAGGIVTNDAMSFSAQQAIAPGNSTTGVGGSMARFTIASDHLYLLDGGTVHAVDIGIATAPDKKSSQYLAWDIETIFPFNNKLFIGARSGMHIFDLSLPENPTKISTYTHINSCDPVVVSGDYAYVTLRSGNQCAGFTNQLEVIDVADATKPTLIKTYPMYNPHGLGIDKSTLFICDGSDGLKVYNVTDKQNIDKNLLKHYKNIHAYDVIPFNNVLMLIGETGIYQYNYSNPTDITQLSHIAIKP